MMHKFLGLVAVSALIFALFGCLSSSNSSNAASDECTENPTAPGCVVETEDEPAAE